MLALERPLPSAAASCAPCRDTGAARASGPAACRTRRADTTLDGMPVRYVRFVSPPRPLSYANWGRWAARPFARALDELHGEWPFDLVHAHYAVPAGDAVLRWMRRGNDVPLVVSVHGGDLSYTAARSERGREVVSRVLRAAGRGDRQQRRHAPRDRGARRPAARICDVVHPGADVPSPASSATPDPTLVTVAHLEPHKNQAAVIRALAALRDRHPRLRYVLIGEGPGPRVARAARRSPRRRRRVRSSGR